MPNMMQRSAAWLGTKMQTAGGRPVIYRRGTKTVAITVTPLDLEEVVVTTENVGIEIDKHDWTVTASELVINGETVLPQRGDVIAETLNSHDYEYQVVSAGRDRPCWEWLDKGTRQLLRVHTTKIKGP